MFIISKKNFKVRRADGSSFLIPRDYIGEIPDDVAANWLVQAAIKDGSVATPHGRKDAQLEAAASDAGRKAGQSDIRPDAKAKREDMKNSGKATEAAE